MFVLNYKQSIPFRVGKQKNTQIRDYSSDVSKQSTYSSTRVCIHLRDSTRCASACLSFRSGKYILRCYYKLRRNTVGPQTSPWSDRFSCLLRKSVLFNRISTSIANQVIIFRYLLINLQRMSRSYYCIVFMSDNYLSAE